MESRPHAKPKAELTRRRAFPRGARLKEPVPLLERGRFLHTL
ncbi:hypothetical protein AKJ08_1034 [Vulgatibacter incomptus]|uniref:Uncharacterized protein n=1 Tax=Vulgatibacter incomptus TaxID=1391653 RepID=A0A0K1PAW5_9BACT|nr:hypothetical protein AKJ08_1034 [Vulgatibacter incomptus]